MVIALPVEGFNSLEAIGENGEDLAKVCHKVWGSGFSINPVSDKYDGGTYAEAIREMTPKVIKEIVEEIIAKRGGADIPLDEAQYDAE